MLFDFLCLCFCLRQVTNAAGEDNELHLELEDSKRKLVDLLKNLHLVGEDEDAAVGVDEQWQGLRSVITDSSIDAELDHVREVISTLQSHSVHASSKLYYFVILNMILFLGIFLWSRAKSSYSYGGGRV